MYFMNDLIDLYVDALRWLYKARPIYAFVAVGATLASVVIGVLTALLVTSPSGVDLSTAPGEVSTRLRDASQDLQAISSTIAQGQQEIDVLSETIDVLGPEATDLQTFLDENPEERELLQRLASSGGRPIWLDIVFLFAGIVGGTIAGVIVDRFLTTLRGQADTQA